MDPTIPLTSSPATAVLVPTVKIHRDFFTYLMILITVAGAQLGLFYKPQLGAYLTIIALAILMCVAARLTRLRGIVLAAAIIPLLGMINLSFVEQSAYAQTLVLYGSMLMLSLTYRFAFRKRITSVNSHLSVRGYAKYLPIFLGAGVLLGILSYRLLTTSYVFGGVSLSLVVIVAVLGAVAEESMFRGLIERQAMDIMRPAYAVILTSLLYMTLSFSHFTKWSLLVGGISTLILSYVYLKKPNLILTTSLNLTSKLVYVYLIARFLVR